MDLSRILSCDYPSNFHSCFRCIGPWSLATGTPVSIAGGQHVCCLLAPARSTICEPCVLASCCNSDNYCIGMGIDLDARSARLETKLACCCNSGRSCFVDGAESSL